MAKKHYQYKGQHFELDEKYSPEEALDLIKQHTGEMEPAGRALSGAEDIKPAPAYQARTHPMQPSPYKGLIEGEGEMTMPFSLEDVLETIPAIGQLAGAGVGGMIGRPGIGGAVGGGGGELLKQYLRKAVGGPPATGLTQNMLGLDPNSIEARGVDVLMEMLGGPLFDKAGRAVARGAPGAEDTARRFYQKAIDPDMKVDEALNFQEHLKVLEGATPAGIDPAKAVDVPMPEWTPHLGGDFKRSGLPFPGRKQHMKEAAHEMVESAGPQVKKFYGRDDVVMPHGLKPGRESVETELERGIETPPHPILRTEKVEPEAKGFGMPYEEADETILVEDMTKGTYRRDDMAKALKERAANLKGRQEARETAIEEGFSGPFSAREIWEAKKAAADQAKAATANVFDPGTIQRGILPKARAFMEEERGLRGSLEEAIPEGALASKRFQSAKTFQDYLEQNATNNSAFLQRWATSRMIGGQVGTAAGLLAASPRLLRGMGWKFNKELAVALRQGDDNTVKALIRAFMTAKTRPETEDE